MITTRYSVKKKVTTSYVVTAMGEEKLGEDEFQGRGPGLRIEVRDLDTAEAVCRQLAEQDRQSDEVIVCLDPE